MPTLEQRIKFAQQYIVTKEGRPFSLEGRQWVLDHFWGPMDGWKLWPVDPLRLCDCCRDRAGQIVSWSPELVAELAKHKTEGDCPGLNIHKIMTVAINVPRREGKTLNTAAYILTELFLAKNKAITYVASAGKQTQRLFRENFEALIENNKTLKNNCELLGDSIRVKTTNSLMTYSDSSHRSITGTGRTLIVIDEARDVEARVATALIPSMRDQNGKECVAGHMNVSRQSDKENCTVCGRVLVPWFGRVLIISSSGIIEGNVERDWFAELVNRQEEEPHPTVHLYRTIESSNPSVAPESTEMLSEVFGQIEGMKTYMDVELSNVSRMKGEDFVSAAALKEVTDNKLSNHEGSPLRCVAYLDVSTVQDNTSLIIVAQDPDKNKDPLRPWEYVKVIRTDIWKPKDMGGVIKPEKIQEHLEYYMPLFPNLVSLHVDVRGSITWAIDLVRHCREKIPVWGRKCKSDHGQQAERDLGWNQLESRILHKRITLPNHKDLLAEIRGVRRQKRLDGSVEIRDRDRKTRHADVAEGLASCCYHIYVLMTNQQRSMEDVDPRTTVKNMLDRIYRPGSGSLNGDSF